MKDLRPKMLFIHDVLDGEEHNMVFCNQKCDSCPIRYVCITSGALAFNVFVNYKSKTMERCEPYETSEQRARAL